LHEPHAALDEPPGEQAVGGTAGHLYVVLHVQGDERFHREGADILSDVTIGMAKAALGGEVEVYTLEEACTGSTTLEIKPGTQPGDHIVRRGQGIPRVRRVRPWRPRGALQGRSPQEAERAPGRAAARTRHRVWRRRQREAQLLRPLQEVSALSRQLVAPTARDVARRGLRSTTPRDAWHARPRSRAALR
ncbi:MAG: hypothetical protein HC863_01265, partial [Myxococcales bacterium]|nr:hypothetical protein [Myxococcales bacterium]